MSYDSKFDRRNIIKSTGSAFSGLAALSLSNSVAANEDDDSTAADGDEEIYTLDDGRPIIVDHETSTFRYKNEFSRLTQSDQKGDLDVNASDLNAPKDVTVQNISAQGGEREVDFIYPIFKGIEVGVRVLFGDYEFEVEVCILNNCGTWTLTPNNASGYYELDAGFGRLEVDLSADFNNRSVTIEIPKACVWIGTYECKSGDKQTIYEP